MVRSDVGSLRVQRYAKGQKEQILGQAIGLPLFMALFTFVGLAVTSATVPIFGTVISDPIELMGRLQGFLPVLLALIGASSSCLTLPCPAATDLGCLQALRKMRSKRGKATAWFQV